MADLKGAEKQLKETVQKEKETLENAYGEVITMLNDEKDKLQKELRHEFRNARRYVRANPEAGIGAAFAGGIVVGIVVSKIFKR